MNIPPSFAIVFDLDGTLIDSSPDVFVAINKTLEYFGLNPLRYDVMPKLVGEGAQVMLSRAFNESGLLKTSKIKEAENKFDQLEDPNASKETKTNSMSIPKIPISGSYFWSGKSV